MITRKCDRCGAEVERDGSTLCEGCLEIQERSLEMSQELRRSDNERDQRERTDRICGPRRKGVRSDTH